MSEVIKIKLNLTSFSPIPFTTKAVVTYNTTRATRNPPTRSCWCQGYCWCLCPRSCLRGDVMLLISTPYRFDCVTHQLHLHCTRACTRPNTLLHVVIPSVTLSMESVGPCSTDCRKVEHQTPAISPSSTHVMTCPPSHECVI